MGVCLLIASLLVFVNAVIATGAWTLFAKHATRPRWARASGAVLGAAVGTGLAGPQLRYVFEAMCGYFPNDPMCDGSLPVPVLILYPFTAPFTTGLFAWLLAEIGGGRGIKPLFTLGLTVLGAALGAALIFVPWYFIAAVDHSLPHPIRDILVLSVPALGALIALDRWSR
jgi:hypothetical protein